MKVDVRIDNNLKQEQIPNQLAVMGQYFSECQILYAGTIELHGVSQ
jgi:hypothetical protein